MFHNLHIWRKIFENWESEEKKYEHRTLENRKYINIQIPRSQNDIFFVFDRKSELNHKREFLTWRNYQNKMSSEFRPQIFSRGVFVLSRIWKKEKTYFEILILCFLFLDSIDIFKNLDIFTILDHEKSLTPSYNIVRAIL